MISVSSSVLRLPAGAARQPESRCFVPHRACYELRRGPVLCPLSSVLRRLSSVVFAILLCAAASCAGKPIDPLAADRERLLALEHSPLEAGWPSQATVLLSDKLLAARAHEAVTSALAQRGESSRVRVLGMELRVIPRVEIERISFAPAAACPSCVVLSAELGGGVEVSIGAAGAPAVPRSGPTAGNETVAALGQQIGLRATTTGTVELFVTPLDGGGRLLQARAAPEGEWGVQLELDGLSEEWNLGLSQLLEEQLRETVALRRIPDFDLEQLPAEGPLRIRDLRARAAPEGLAVDFAFAVLEAGVAPSAPDARDGWVAAVPAETALGLARAAALRADSIDGHAPEPIRLDLDADRYALTLRLWRVAPKPTYRDFVIEGHFARTAAGELALEVDETREIGAGGREINPVAILTRARILQTLEQSLAAVMPATQRRRVAGHWIEVELLEPVAREQVLYLYGTASILSPPDPAALTPADAE